MFQPFKSLLVASLLLGVALTSAVAAEREDVRKAINLVTSVKMPFPEGLSRNRARTERVWLEREGATTGCIRLEDRRWCCSARGHGRHSFGDMTDTFSARQVDGSDVVSGEEDPILSTD
jgi:hypothetical protein